MIIDRSLIALGLLFAAFAPALSQSANRAEPGPPQGPLSTLAEVHDALRGCWRWPPARETPPGLTLTVQVSFKSNGELFGTQITYQSEDVPEEARALYSDALLKSLERCSPLPLSESLGKAIAGRQMVIHIRDTQQPRLVIPSDDQR